MPNRGNINGKRFEHEISISLKNISPWPFPRLLDGGSRNSTPVPFDFLVLFPNGEIAGLECKEKKGLSMPLAHLRPHQTDALKMLSEWGHQAYFVINLLFPSRHINRCFLITPEAIDKYVVSKGVKSISLR